jgi:O-antigen ligase
MFILLQCNIFTASKNKLKKFILHNPLQSIAMIACLTVITGLFIGRAMISIGMIVLFASVFFQKDILQKLIGVVKHPVFAPTILLYIVYAISGIWSSNTASFWGVMQLHLPFLILPFAVLSFQKFSGKDLQLLFFAFIVCSSIAAVWSTVQYLQNKDFFDEAYLHAKVIPTPFSGDHVRFSLAIAMAFFMCIWNIWKSNSKLHKYIHTFLAIWLMAYIHILSVKTGLVVFYFGCGLIAMNSIVQFKKIKLGIAAIVCIALLPIIAFKYSKSFRQKLAYFNASVDKMKNTERDANYSDEGRVISYELALRSIKKNKILGVGAGDMYTAMQDEYALEFAADKMPKILLPHNQFLVVQLGTGIIGTIAYLLFLLYPFLFYYRKKLLLLMLAAVVLVPQLVEPFHEIQYGITLHIFWLCICVRYLDLQREAETA